jgi:hypothetical protein
MPLFYLFGMGAIFGVIEDSDPAFLRYIVLDSPRAHMVGTKGMIGKQLAARLLLERRMDIRRTLPG